jgi:hypothetical protein
MTGEPNFFDTAAGRYFRVEVRAKKKDPVVHTKTDARMNG